VGPSDPDDYCPFTKAIEHLGDRWTLLLLRQLAMVGPMGFNALASALPGRISRSVLADRLSRLEALGLVTRGGRQDREVPYRLTSAGQALLPTFLALREWSATWLPDDPAMAERDFAVLLAWLATRARPGALPRRDVVLEIGTGRQAGQRGWLVLRRGATPYGCVDDPLMDQTRYVYVQATVPALLALARGRRAWPDAIADGSVVLSGDPALTRRLATWFQPTEAEPDAATSHHAAYGGSHALPSSPGATNVPVSSSTAGTTPFSASAQPGSGRHVSVTL
jgi:DNA-binding HxlR family transcriptional regulator